MTSDKRYETIFDSFYQKEWKHDASLSKSDLLLTGYPFSVDINLTPGDVWLELGVGSGRVVDFHAHKLQNITCIGVDRSFAAIERLKATLPVEIDSLVADVRNLPFRSESFDLITLFGTIQAYSKEHWFDGIDNLMPLLKDSGRLGFSVHPVSVLELIRGLKNPPDFGELATDRFLQGQLLSHNYDQRYKIERHKVFVLLQKMTNFLKVQLCNWYGFTEYPDTERNRNFIRLFAKYFSWFTFGHYWVWIEK